MSSRPRLLGTTVSGVLAAALPLLAGCDRPAPTGADERIGAAEQHLTQCVTFQRGTLGTLTDAVIKSNALTGNFGSDGTLSTSDKQEVLLQVDLGSIPSYAVVESATLKLFINATGNGNGTGIVTGNGNAYGLGNGNGNNTASAAIDIHRALAPWSESTVTYTSFNQQFEGTTVASIMPSSAGSQKSADLTGLVQAWVNGSKANHGVLLETTDKKQTIFVSSEGAQAYRPALEVCYSVPDEHCVPNPCENGGTCLNGWTGYTCQCAPGYTGDDCETDIDDCAAAPCLNGGTCVDGVNSYTCQCAAGFEGLHCETNIDECAPNPCQNGGVCTDGINAYTCACAPGYTGDDCEIDIDECAAGPCQNGGQCADLVNGYFCTCAAGFGGDDCETNIDDCAGHLCENEASCVDGIADYTCACLPGFTGTYCETNIDDCAPENPCLHGGTCADGVNGYACECVPGYTGDNCEIDIDDCSPNPCQNEGICVDGVNGYTCDCAQGWTGTNCGDVDHCAADPCHVTTPYMPVEAPTGVSCTNTAGGFTCECKPLIGGATCETLCPCFMDAITAGDFDTAYPWLFGGFGAPALACATYDGGTAVSLGEGEMWFGAAPFACLGNSNYSSFEPPIYFYSDADQQQACQGAIDFAIANAGITCSDAAPCDSNPCQNGGECLDYGATPYCICPPNYLGDDCSILGACLQSASCGNAETCTSLDETDYTCSTLILAGTSGGESYSCDPPVATGTKTILRAGAADAVWLASDALGTSAPYFDDLAVVTVTSPSNDVAKLNVASWQEDCVDPSAPTVYPGDGALDITSLFGSETGTFTVKVDVRNANTTYYWNETHVGITHGSPSQPPPM